MPRIEIPSIQIEIATLTVAKAKALTDDELLEILSGQSKLKGIISLPLQQLITAELLSRGLARASAQRWEVKPSFILLIASVAIGIAGLLVSVLALPQVQKFLTQEIQSQQQARPAADMPINSPQQQAAPQLPKSKPATM